MRWCKIRTPAHEIAGYNSVVELVEQGLSLCHGTRQAVYARVHKLADVVGIHDCKGSIGAADVQ